MIIILLVLSTPPSDTLDNYMSEVYGVPATILPPAAVEPSTPTVQNTPQQQLLAITLAYNNRLTPHPFLMNSAQAVADYHASTGRWGHSSRSIRPGASENIAWNSQQSINKISSQWRGSRGHNSNWLGNWKYAGVGVAYANGRIYAVQHFSNSPAQHSPVVLQSQSRARRFRLFRR